MTASPDLLWSCGGQDVRLAGALDTPAQRRVLAGRLLAGLCTMPKDFRLGHDALGRPLALSASGAPLGPGLSFSRHTGWLWAATALLPDLGMDATGPEDFLGSYPDARVFGPAELVAARTLTSSLPEARALLWSLKEAAAKALGTGLRAEPRMYVAEDLRSRGPYLSCRVSTPHGRVNALASGWHGFHLAVALRSPETRNPNA